jgi:hypothetical protein
MALVLKHQTAAQFAARVWSALRSAQSSGAEADKLRADRICWRLYGWYLSGDFTAAELRATYNTFFGAALTQTQFNNTVVPKLLAARDRYQAALDAALV